MYKIFHYSFEGYKVYVPKIRRKFLFFRYWSSIIDEGEDNEYTLPIMFNTLKEAEWYVSFELNKII